MKASGCKDGYTCPRMWKTHYQGTNPAFQHPGRMHLHKIRSIQDQFRKNKYNGVPNYL